MAATERAYINDHDTVAFLTDDDERLQDFLNAGYRELTPEDRVVTQSAEITPVDPANPGGTTYGDLASMHADGDFIMADMNATEAELIPYITKVRELRAKNDAARHKAMDDRPPAKVVRKGRGK